MEQAARICVAIKSGATNSNTIAEAIGSTRSRTSPALTLARKQGYIVSAGRVRQEGQRQSSHIWSLTPQGLVTAEGAPSGEIPGWVLPLHVDVYREIAHVLGEETAAKYARAAKRLVQ